MINFPEGGSVDRIKAFTQDGSLMGFISYDSEPYALEGTIQLAFLITKDGNIWAVWQDVADANPRHYPVGHG